MCCPSVPLSKANNKSLVSITTGFLERRGNVLPTNLYSKEAVPTVHCHMLVPEPSLVKRRKFIIHGP